MKRNNYTIDDLAKLIKALSGAEKRHFSLLSATFIKGEKEPLYLKLFQSLAYGNSDLSDFEILPEITPVKKRLFQNVLKSLRIYHHEKSVEIKLQHYLSDIEILYGLNLSKQSYYIFQNAYDLALINEKFTFLLQLLEWEKKLNMVLDKPFRSIETIAGQEKHVLNQLMQVMDLENLFSKMKSLKRQYGQVRGAEKDKLVKEVARLTKNISYEKCISQKAKFYYNFTYTIYNWITYNHDAAYKCSKEMLQTGIKDIHPGDYIDGILEHSTSCIQIGAFSESLEMLELAKHVIKQLRLEQVPVLANKLFFYTIGYCLVIYNYTGNKEQLLLTIQRAEEEIKLHENNMPKEAMLVLTANLMNAYVGAGNMRMVDELWNNLFQKSSKSVRRSIYDDLRMFRLFYLLQNKAYSVIPSMALSAQRYYTNAPIDFRLELNIASLLIRDHDYTKAAVRNKIFDTIKNLISNHIKLFQNNIDFQEHYTFYIIWIESIKHHKPFHEMAAAWYHHLKRKMK